MNSDYELEELLLESKRRTAQGGVFKRYFNTLTTRVEYPKHWQFFDAGKEHRQRLFRAANRVGA